MAIKSTGSTTSSQAKVSSRGSSSAPKSNSKPAAPQAPKAPNDGVSVSREAKSSTSECSRLPDLASSFGDLGTNADTSPNSTSAEQNASNPQTSSLELGEGQLLSQGRGQAEKITQLQEMLNSGGGSLEVDGVFGPRTAEAVRNFQRERGLQVDGIVGPQTLAALNGGSEASGQGQDGATVDGQPPADGTDGTNPDGGVNNDSTQPNGPVDGQTTGDVPPGQSTTRLQGIPERPEDARGGREFMEALAQLPAGPQREQAILQEILSGNIPDASRELQELVVNRGGRELRMHAMSDYLAVGSNEDNVRVPMTPAVAEVIAQRTGTSLPTDRIVDDIHGQARQLHMPTFSSNRESVGTFLSHDQRIDEQLGSGSAPGDFVSGHKKDLVIPRRNGRVAIYGGRWANGSRIQGYSNVHGENYVDYSHGARLVSQQVTVDGRSMTLDAALADPSLRGLFTNH